VAGRWRTGRIEASTPQTRHDVRRLNSPWKRRWSRIVLALMDAELQEQLSYDTSRSRVLSSLLVACYLAVAFMLSGTVLALKMFVLLDRSMGLRVFSGRIRGAISPILGRLESPPRSFVCSSAGWPCSYR